MLGLTSDAPNDGDWFRSTLGGRSVFVQRFGNELRGFENRCAHRFYPLRIAETGHGVIRCGFHHWRYDKDGRAVGIPQCLELFGKSPRELGARLNPVEIATCGVLVFGRFAAPDADETLEHYLGDGFAILQAMTAGARPTPRLTRAIAANWKLCFHMTLDDYHIVAVHPHSFGRSGYLKPERVHYFRFGRHSTFLESGSLTALAAQCRDGSYRPSDYRILQIFPNLVIAQLCVARTWYVFMQQYRPATHDKTSMRAWAFPTPFPAMDANRLDRLLRLAARPWLPPFIRYFWSKLMREDHDVCERLQTNAHQIVGSPILGKQEERIAWFEEVYAEAVAPTPATSAELGLCQPKI
ncbi:MAG: aromatic ring-hydroxylating oxygenase subunit alpha [Pseudolabrys sp.]